MPNKKWERKIPNGKLIDALIKRDEHRAAISTLTNVRINLRERAKRTVELANKVKGKERDRLLARAKVDVARSREIDQFLHG